MDDIVIANFDMILSSLEIIVVFVCCCLHRHCRAASERAARVECWFWISFHIVACVWKKLKCKLTMYVNIFSIRCMFCRSFVRLLARCLPLFIAVYTANIKATIILSIVCVCVRLYRTAILNLLSSLCSLSSYMLLYGKM